MHFLSIQTLTKALFKETQNSLLNISSRLCFVEKDGGDLFKEIIFAYQERMAQENRSPFPMTVFK